MGCGYLVGGSLRARRVCGWSCKERMYHELVLISKICLALACALLYLPTYQPTYLLKAHHIPITSHYRISHPHPHSHTHSHTHTVSLLIPHSSSPSLAGSNTTAQLLSSRSSDRFPFPFYFPTTSQKRKKFNIFF